MGFGDDIEAFCAFVSRGVKKWDEVLAVIWFQLSKPSCKSSPSNGQIGLVA